MGSCSDWLSCFICGKIDYVDDMFYCEICEYYFCSECPFEDDKEMCVECYDKRKAEGMESENISISESESESESED